MTAETFLGQILRDGQWQDYARGTEGDTRRWQEGDPGNRRVVDWIYKEKVLIPPAQTEPPLTKTEAREYLARARASIRDAESALRVGDRETLLESVLGAEGALGEIDRALGIFPGAPEPRGIRGVT